MAGRDDDFQLRKMNRRQLVEIIYALQKKNKEVSDERDQLKHQLEKRGIAISNAGSIAEASLNLSGIFEDAQQAADAYLANVKAMSGQNRSIDHTPPIKAIEIDLPTEVDHKASQLVVDAKVQAEEIVDEAEQKAKTLVDEANKQADQIVQDANQQADQIVEDAKVQADQIIGEAQQKAQEITDSIQVDTPSCELFDVQAISAFDDPSSSVAGNPANLTLDDTAAAFDIPTHARFEDPAHAMLPDPTHGIPPFEAIPAMPFSPMGINPQDPYMHQMQGNVLEAFPMNPFLYGGELDASIALGQEGFEGTFEGAFMEVGMDSYAQTDVDPMTGMQQQDEMSPYIQSEIPAGFEDGITEAFVPVPNDFHATDPLPEPIMPDSDSEQPNPQDIPQEILDVAFKDSPQEA